MSRKKKCCCNSHENYSRHGRCTGMDACTGLYDIYHGGK